jgi:hypothetical protein
MVRRAADSRSAAMLVVAALCAFPVAAQTADHSRITLTATTRAYTVGDTSVSENVAQVRYELFAPRVRFRLDGSALRYSAPAAEISGRLPLVAQLDFERRAGDTLTAFFRTSSAPYDLSARETAALSSSGTSTIDLQSSSFGTVAVGGGRMTLAYPVGDAVLALRGGFEYEPRPAGSQPVYWRGSTVRGGLSLTANSGEASYTGAIDVSHSSADSLGGRNLFPGGGSVALQLFATGSVLNPFDPLEDERWPLRAILFYARPFGNDRADQPNLIIPDGDLFGAVASMLVPVGGVTVSPLLQYLRETSTSGSISGILRSDVSGNAWTFQSGLDVAIPAGDRFEITPQAGYAFGSVGATFAQSTVLRRGRVGRTSAFSDAIRGSWLSLQISATF